MTKPQLLISAETVIVNLLQEDRKGYITLGRLERLIEYIHQQLVKRELLSEYQDVVFNINFEAIERTILYNNVLFELVDDTIFLKQEIPEKMSQRCQTDDNIIKIIRDFIDTTNLDDKEVVL